MNRSTWKAIERKWATWLGGERVPVTGRQRGAEPDVRHPCYSIEVKCGTRLLSQRLRTGWAQAKASSIKDGKLPILCVTQREEGKRDSEHFVICDLETWQQITGDGPKEDE